MIPWTRRSFLVKAPALSVATPALGIAFSAAKEAGEAGKPALLGGAKIRSRGGRTAFARECEQAARLERAVAALEACFVERNPVRNEVRTHASVADVHAVARRIDGKRASREHAGPERFRNRSGGRHVELRAAVDRRLGSDPVLEHSERWKLGA